MLQPVSPFQPIPPPLADLAVGLEETCAHGPRDMPAALAFLLARTPVADHRGVGMVVTRDWLRERGRPYGPGFSRVGQARKTLLVVGRNEAEALWAMEQALRSGGLALVVGGIDGADLTQTRRLEFAARDGGAAGVLLRTRTGDLSAARRRWRITTLASSTEPHDPRSPGRSRVRAEMTRSRGERPGVWILEQDDETYRLRLADRLAGDGHDPVGQAAA